MRRHKAKERGDNSVHWILDSFFILSFFVSHLFFRSLWDTLFVE